MEFELRQSYYGDYRKPSEFVFYFSQYSQLEVKLRVLRAESGPGRVPAIAQRPPPIEQQVFIEQQV